MKINLININSLLIILFPFALVSGPLIPEIFVFILVFSFLYLALSKKDYYYFNNNFVKIFSLFFILINISSFINFNFISIKSSIFYFRFGLFALAIFYFLNENDKLLNLFFKSLTLLIFIFFIDSIYQFFYKVNLIGLVQNLNGRISSFFGEELIMGSFFSKLFLFYISIMIWIKPRKKILEMLIIVFVFFTLVYLSASRTALVSFFLSLILLFLILKNYKIFFLLIPIMGIMIFLINQYDDGKFKRLYNHTIHQLFEGSSSFNFLSQRHHTHFLTAYNIFLDHKIFGAGPKSFRMLCDNDKYIPYSFIEEANLIKAKADGELVFKLSNLNKLDKRFNGGKEFVVTDAIFDYFLIYPHREIKPMRDYIPRFSDNNMKTLEVFLVQKNKKITKIEIRNVKDFILLVRNKNVKKNQIIGKTKKQYPNGCNTHPHNFVLQILSETGLVGLTFYVGVIFYLLLGLLNFLTKTNLFNKIFKYNVETKVSLMFASYLVFFFPLLPSGNFFNNWLSLMIYLPLGFLLKLIYIKKNN